MLQAFIRRLLLLFTAICGLSFGLILVHSLVEPTGFHKPLAGLGAALAFLVLLINWSVMVKTDDYLVPFHAFLYFIFAIVVAWSAAGLAFFFFYLSDDYPFSFLLFFGLIPIALALLFGLIAYIRIKEAASLPIEYQPSAERTIWSGILPPIFSILILSAAVFLLVRTIQEINFTSQFDTSMAKVAEKTLLTTDKQTAQAEESLSLARRLQAQNHYRRSHDEFVRAGSLGNVEANYELGLIYQGDGFYHDFDKAVEHLELAAEQDHTEALYLLGRAYRHGELGLTRDPARAVRYLEKAGKQGQPEAQKQLANIYNRGESGEPDGEKAIFWFRKAAEQGDAVAQNDLGILLVNGTAPEEGIEWLIKAADQDVTVAEFNLANAYSQGDLVEKDQERAFYYYSRLAEKRLPFGFRMVGLHLLTGEGVEKDPTAAFESFWQGAARGDVESTYYVGYCYLNGIGVTLNTSEALIRIESAALQRHPPAQLLLGQIYLEGDIILEDKVEAAKWLILASDNGSEEARLLIESLTPNLTREELGQANHLATALQAEDID